MSHSDLQSWCQVGMSQAGPGAGQVQMRRSGKEKQSDPKLREQDKDPVF
jgi:hypothetical protein